MSTVKATIVISFHRRKVKQLHQIEAFTGVGDPSYTISVSVKRSCISKSGNVYNVTVVDFSKCIKGQL